MIPWWMLAMLLKRPGPVRSVSDRQLHERIAEVSARITARHNAANARQLTYTERMRFTENGRLPDDLATLRFELIKDMQLLEKLMREARRRAGGLQLRR